MKTSSGNKDLTEDTQVDSFQNDLTLGIPLLKALALTEADSIDRGVLDAEEDHLLSYFWGTGDTGESIFADLSSAIGETEHLGTRLTEVNNDHVVGFQDVSTSANDRHGFTPFTSLLESYENRVSPVEDNVVHITRYCIEPKPTPFVQFYVKNSTEYSYSDDFRDTTTFHLPHIQQRPEYYSSINEKSMVQPLPVKLAKPKREKYFNNTSIPLLSLPNVTGFIKKAKDSGHLSSLHQNFLAQSKQFSIPNFRTNTRTSIQIPCMKEDNNLPAKNQYYSPEYSDLTVNERKSSFHSHREKVKHKPYTSNKKCQNLFENNVILPNIYLPYLPNQKQSHHPVHSPTENENVNKLPYLPNYQINQGHHQETLDKNRTEILEKRSRRLARNRESARQSRRRKKELLESLEEKVKLLHTKVEDERYRHITSMESDLQMDKTKYIQQLRIHSHESKSDIFLKPKINVLVQTVGPNCLSRQAIATFQYNFLRKLVLQSHQLYILWLSLKQDIFLLSAKKKCAEANRKTGRVSSKLIGEELATISKAKNGNVNCKMDDKERVWPMICYELGITVDQEERCIKTLQSLRNNVKCKQMRSQVNIALTMITNLEHGVLHQSNSSSHRSESALIHTLSPNQVVRYLHWYACNKDRCRKLLFNKMRSHSSTNVNIDEESCLAYSKKIYNEVKLHSESHTDIYQE